MRVFKNIIKKLAKRYLSCRELTELLWKDVFFHSEKVNWEDAQHLFTNIFIKYPDFRKYILLRKSQLLNSLFEEDKNYIQGAINELSIMENLYNPQENILINKKEEDKNEISIKRFLEYFKGR